MQLAVVLNKPEYAGNIGFVARTMANFGFSSLLLVNPKANHLSGEAKSRAMHAQNILRKAKTCNSLKKALSPFDFAVATTAKPTAPNKMQRTALTVQEFAQNFSHTNAKLALVFGSEKNGLTNNEISLCDFIVHVPTARSYKAMNLSHAVTVLLYELHKGKSKKKFKTMNKKTKTLLIKKFDLMIEKAGNIKNKKSVRQAFRSLISRTPLTKKEAKTLLAVFSGVLKEK